MAEAVWLALWAFAGLPSVAVAQAIDLHSPVLSANDLWHLAYAIIVAFAVEAPRKLPPNFTMWQKRGIAAFCSLVLSIVTLWYAGCLDLGNLAMTWLVVFIAASGIYVAVMNPAADWVAGRPRTRMSPQSPQPRTAYRCRGLPTIRTHVLLSRSPNRAAAKRR
jgi:phosphatidylserine synthase